jgi:hypothetical protein
MKHRRNIKELGMILVLASTMGFLLCPECFEKWEYLWKMETIMLTIWLVMWYGNKYISYFIDQYISWLENPAKRFALGISGSLIFSVSAILLLAILFEKLFNISIGGGWENIWVTIGATLVVLLFMLSKQFLYSWRALSIREEKMRNEVLASKFHVLKSQINPHFMFNSLNTLNSLIYQDQDLAAKYVGELSKVYRTVLTSAKNEIVTVAEELIILDSYIFLQTIRFEDRFSVKINLSEKTRKMYIPPMVLQMLIENAIKHNELTTANPLLVEVFDEDGYINVKNKISIKQVLPGDNSSTGLSNIEERYKAFSDVPVVIFNDGGHFIIKLPLLAFK